jgi:hypothetical protein
MGDVNGLAGLGAFVLCLGSQGSVSYTHLATFI